MKKALVTGANGFIGKALVGELINQKVEVIALDREDLGIFPDTRFAVCDLRNCEAMPSLISDRDIDTVFHLAWGGASGDLRADYAMQLENVKMTCDMVNTAAKMNIKKFVGAGTLAQYDCLAYVGEDNSVPSPVSCYGTAKIAAQYMSKAAANKAGIEHVWCIISNLYGVGDTTNNFINFAAKKLLNGERASFTAAEQNYDFVYITDIIQGIYLCGENGKNNNSYYIGSGNARPLKEFIEIMRNAIDSGIPLYLGEVEFKGRSLPPEAFDCRHITNDTGYVPKVRFEDGIVDTIKWLKGEIK